jgi:hypothetical protein
MTPPSLLISESAATQFNYHFLNRQRHSKTQQKLVLDRLILAENRNRNQPKNNPKEG